MTIAKLKHAPGHYTPPLKGDTVSPNPSKSEKTSYQKISAVREKVSSFPVTESHAMRHELTQADNDRSLSEIKEIKLQIPFTTRDLATHLNLNEKKILGAFVFGSQAWKADPMSKSDWDVCVVVNESIDVNHKRSRTNFSLDATIIGKAAFLKKIDQHDFHYMTLALLPSDCVLTNKMNIQTKLNHQKLKTALEHRRGKDLAKFNKFKAKGKIVEAEKILGHVNRMDQFFEQMIALPQISISRIEEKLSVHPQSMGESLL